MNDPITGRNISRLCWDGKHFDPTVSMDYRIEHLCMGAAGLCGCLCHPRNQPRLFPIDQPHIDAAIEGCPTGSLEEEI